MNYLSIALVTVAAIVVGVIIFLFLQPPPRRVECIPTNAPVQPSSGPLERQAEITWNEDSVTPKEIHVQGPDILLIINNPGSRQHNIVLASVGPRPDCKETTLGSTESILSKGTRNIRRSLQPGTYIIYCDIREEKSTHRSPRARRVGASHYSLMRF